MLFYSRENFHEYGTILKIRDVQYLPDGQMFVDCVGERRFRVLTKGIQDGYRTGIVEFLRHEPSERDEQSGSIKFFLSAASQGRF